MQWFKFFTTFNRKQKENLMTYPFSFTIAGIASRLKTSVTGLLQVPLQGLRALARLGDVSYPEDPPMLYVR